MEPISIVSLATHTTNTDLRTHNSEVGGSSPPVTRALKAQISAQSQVDFKLFARRVVTCCKKKRGRFGPRFPLIGLRRVFSASLIAAHRGLRSMRCNSPKIPVTRLLLQGLQRLDLFEASPAMIVIMALLPFALVAGLTLFMFGGRP